MQRGDGGENSPLPRFIMIPMTWCESHSPAGLMVRSIWFILVSLFNFSIKTFLRTSSPVFRTGLEILSHEYLQSISGPVSFNI